MKRVSKALDEAYIGVAIALIAVCSWISIPTAVPFTLQTFAVFFVLSFLGGKHGTAAIAIYLLLGAIGIPVFAEFTSGFGVILGTTGGYLIGFILIGLIYWSLVKFFGKEMWVEAVAFVVGLVVLYAFGTAWFMIVYARTTGAIGLWTALGWCVFPFILPDLVKLSLGLFLARKITAIQNKR